MAIFITDASKVVVQGMTGSEGQKHTTRMLASGTNIVGGVNPRKAGTSVTFPKGDSSVDVPVFGRLREYCVRGSIEKANVGRFFWSVLLSV